MIVYPTGASAIGVPGWPDAAFSTASMASVRIVLMASASSEEVCAPANIE